MQPLKLTPFLSLLLFLLCFSFLSQQLQAQLPDTSRNFIIQSLSAASPFKGQFLQRGNTPSPGLKVPAGMVAAPASLDHLVKQKLAAKKLPGNSNQARQSPEACTDTSYRLLLGIYNAWLYVNSVTQTSDDGMLVTALMYDSARRPNYSWKSYGLLIKLDAEGNISWLKQFEESTGMTFSFMYINQAIELQNHDIICAGGVSTNPSSDVYSSVIYRLTPDGNIIWKSSLKNTIGIFNSPSGTFTYTMKSAVEGLNGDVILGGTSNSNLSSGHIATVVRLDNKGKLVWDANYGNHGYDGSYLFGAEGVSVFLQGGQIILVGLSHGTNYPSTPPAVNFLTLDYDKGNLVKKRFFRPVYTDKNEEFRKSYTYYSNTCTFLTNGNILFYGPLFSDFMGDTPVKDHFGVMEFDASFNLVDAYTISSGLRTNYSNNALLFDASGKGAVALFEYLDPYKANFYFGSFSNRQLLNQRKAHYDAGLPTRGGFAFLKDQGYAFVQSYFEDQPLKSYFEFRKMHDSDTSSACLGQDTLLFSILPWHIIEDPAYRLLDPNEPNKMTEPDLPTGQNGSLTSSSIDPCLQTNYCDTVKIHGDPVICGSKSSMVFTAFKNEACGGFVQWHIDAQAVDSFYVLSDSSVRFWFKNMNWRGKLYASLPAGPCNAQALDSMDISMVRLQAQVNLGPDTILCKGNSMKLHAGNSFTSYLWQDGSSDSLLTVSASGLYWVHAADLCGNSFVDSVFIDPFEPVINIGPDRIKCNDDTLRLFAPPGFLDYTWSDNDTAILKGQAVIIDPKASGSYSLIAEERTGCFAYDTLRVTVHTSPPIHLGSDTSLCRGDELALNAGAGFQRYQWSTGDQGQQLRVRSAGTYSVKATTVEGCSSADTLKLLNLYDLPRPNLGPDSVACIGQPRILSTPGNFALYEWSTGSAAPAISINAPGTYWLTVTDIHGCSGSDTTVAPSLVAPPKGFLAADTMICSYGNLVLSPSGRFDRLLWSTGSSAPSITITRPGSYWLEVRDANSCKGRDTVLVGLKDCLEGLYVPSAFTPNHDGLNDVLKPLLFGDIKSFRFQVYNRWGQVVYETAVPGSGWNGNWKGQKQDTGVFVWICTYQLNGKNMVQEKGSVVMVR